MAKAKRIIKRVVIAVAALVAVLFIVVNVALGPIVRKAVEMAGPATLGVPVKVEKVRIFPLLGSVRIDGLVVGAPEGYSADLIGMDHFRTKVQLSSLFGDTIVVREIVVSGPEVTYELSGFESNVGALLTKLGGGEPTKAPEKEKTDGPAKKIVIEHFLFEKGKVRLATTLTGGRGVILPLPQVEMRDIGKEKEGVSAITAIRRTTVAVSVAVLTTVRDGIAGVADIGADAAAAITGAAGAGLQTAGKLASQALAVVGQGATAMAGAAVEGVEAVGGLATEGARVVGGAAAEGAKAVGGAAAEGAKAVGGALRSMGGLFGGKPEVKPEAPATAAD